MLISQGKSGEFPHLRTGRAAGHRAGRARAFAFALGMLLGTLLRRTRPAMAAPLVAFAARLAFRRSGA
jgi:hypothetical protein